MDGFYLPWLQEIGGEAIVVRPDFYFFGTAAKAADVPALLQELFARLDLTPNRSPRATSLSWPADVRREFTEELRHHLRGRPTYLSPSRQRSRWLTSRRGSGS